MSKKKLAADQKQPQTPENAPKPDENKEIAAADLPAPALGREIKFKRTHPDFAYHCGAKTDGLTDEQTTFLVEGGFAEYTDTTETAA